MSKSRPSDVNALAARIVAEATGQVEKTEAPMQSPLNTPDAPGDGADPSDATSDRR